MKSLIQSIRKILFKSQCIVCGEKANDKLKYLCYNCHHKLSIGSSLKKNGNLYYIWNYDSDFRKLISEYKLKNKLGIAKVLADAVEGQFIDIIKKENIEVIVPVPISKLRKLERGFNQVEEILKCLGYPYFKAKRVKNTEHMYKLLSREERNKNIEKSFEIRDLALDGKIILIFDDIVTTGSTVRELIKEIRRSGEPQKIVIFSLAIAKTALETELKF